jgi:hypothetical protein
MMNFVYSLSIREAHLLAMYSSLSKHSGEHITPKGKNTSYQSLVITRIKIILNTSKFSLRKLQICDLF